MLKHIEWNEDFLTNGPLAGVIVNTIIKEDYQSGKVNVMIEFDDDVDDEVADAILSLVKVNYEKQYAAAKIITGV